MSEEHNALLESLEKISQIDGVLDFEINKCIITAYQSTLELILASINNGIRFIYTDNVASTTYKLYDIYHGNVNKTSSNDDDYVIRPNPLLKDWMVTIRVNTPRKYIDIRFWARDELLQTWRRKIRSDSTQTAGNEQAYWYFTKLTIEGAMIHNIPNIPPSDPLQLFNLLLLNNPLDDRLTSYLEIFDWNSTFRKNTLSIFDTDCLCKFFEYLNFIFFEV